MELPDSKLRDFAQETGFELVGIAKAESPETFADYRRWIASGNHADMAYLSKNVAARAHPNSILPGAKSLLMLGVSYRKVLRSDPELRNRFVPQVVPADFTGQRHVRIASYACGLDYHHWIGERLKRIADRHRALFPGETCRGVVDTAPLMERQFAKNAGLGTFGKNTMLIHPHLGSRFFLAALLSTREFRSWDVSRSSRFAMQTTVPDPCGTCRLCLQACPTGALYEPYRLDAGKCLNYWTIEHRGDIPESIRSVLRDHDTVFGCEICQNVCPWNRKNTTQIGDSETSPREDEAGFLDRRAVLRMDEREFRSCFARTPLARPGLSRIQRNLAFLSSARYTEDVQDEERKVVNGGGSIDGKSACG